MPEFPENDPPNITYVDITKYPSTYPELETDLAYFQDSTLILYNSATSSEVVLFSSKLRPNNHFWSENGRYAFYWESFWFLGGDVYRYDRKNKKEEKVPIEFFSISNFSADGEKFFDGGVEGMTYFNMISKKRFNINSLIRNFLQDTSYELFIVDLKWLTSNTFMATEQMRNLSDTSARYYSFFLSDSSGSLTVIDSTRLSGYSAPAAQSDFGNSHYNKDSSYYFYYKDVGGTEYFGGASRQCFIVNTKSQEVQRLLPEAEYISYANFTSRGDQIIFSAFLYNLKGVYRNYVFIANAGGTSPALISNRKISSGYPAVVNVYAEW